MVRAVDRMLVNVWPTLFGYQLLFQVHPVEQELTEEIRLNDVLPAPAKASQSAG
jgi:hypothetical protein